MAGSLAKASLVANHYTPTYARAPRLALDYGEVIALAERRYLFHERLSYESKQRRLEYRDLRTIAVPYGIPIKRLSSNGDELRNDRVSFYCLLMASLRSDDTRLRFARSEERLLLYRLRAAGISILQIKDYFWTDVLMRDELIANYEGGLFRLNFETAFDFFEPSFTSIIDGSARLSLDDVYQIVSQMYKSKLILHIAKQENSLRRNSAVVDALCEAFAARIRPKRIQMITPESFDRLANRSFPPCMFRILDILKKSRTLTFKAQFELSLFLKGLGMDYMAQCNFWKEFACHINLTSVYGMDGHGKDYSPHCCVTMIMRECPKNVYQVQGCPFRYMAKSELKMYLRKMGRGARKEDIEAIGAKVPDHPQVACRLFFDAVFPQEHLEGAGITHPVEFFIESEKRIKRALLEK